MHYLKRGAAGARVRRWQLFLIGRGLEPGPADGRFGPRTEAATRRFQSRHGLTADGIVGPRTVGRAMLLGFDPMFADDWPPRPSFPPLTAAERAKAFGRFRFVRDPAPGDPERIRILDGWEGRNIVRVELPRLRRVRGAQADGVALFHHLAAERLRALWRAWEDAGLLSRILTWGGSFVPRLVRGSTKTLSNHAYGTAFDINAAWNPLGARPAEVGETGSVRELVPLANEHGFYWGGHFRSRPDGMHFEAARLSKDGNP